MAQREKTPAELQAMREGGRILATIFRDLREQIKPGVNELELNDWTAKEIARHGAEATYLTEEVKFPGVICISVNDELVHSPAVDYVLKEGDLIKCDLVITYKGMKVDSAFTTVVGGRPTAAQKHLMKATERALFAGIDAIKGPTHVGDISAAIEKVLSDAKVGIVRELVGHGIGHEMHEAPEVPNYGKKGTGVLLTPGDTIAIEPMASLGSERIKVDDDKWTISMKDGSLGAHFEHTVLITEDGPEVLTLL